MKDASPEETSTNACDVHKNHKILQHRLVQVRATQGASTSDSPILAQVGGNKSPQQVVREITMSETANFIDRA